MADRETILADFQACTGNDDIGVCIAILEEHNWNLMEAVQNAMSGLDSAAEAPPSYASATQAASFSSAGLLDDDMAQFRSIVHTSHSDSGGGLGGGGGSGGAMAVGAAGAEGAVIFPPASLFPSTSAEIRGARPAPIRLLDFRIEYRDQNISLTVPDNEPVGKIKELLQNDTGISPDKMQLCGWVNKNDTAISDSDLLRELRLPKENTLFLLVPDVNHSSIGGAASGAATNNGESSILERLSQQFELVIRHVDANQEYKLKFPGSKTIQEVKSDMFHLINVPARHQQWTGWPEAADKDETMTLAGSGITLSHNLEIRAASTAMETRRSTRQQTHMRYCQSVDTEMDTNNNEESDDSDSTDPSFKCDHEVIEVDSDEEDFEDATDQFNDEDDMFEADDTEESIGRRPQPLMPENAKDQTEALECFSREFSSRYGECQPVFFIGQLEDAIKEALQCSAKDRKLLAIYLHHDASILANVFCSQVLCDESVVAYLSNNFITWAWDLTAEINKARLLTECTRHFGSVAASTVRNFSLDQLPLLLLISRNRATNEVVQVIHGNNTLDELMTSLIHSQEVFTEQQRADIIEEAERDQRESVLREQDDAYQMSLAADRLKAEERRREEDEQRRAQEAEIQQQQEQMEKQRQEEEEKEAIRQSIADQLPDEPPDGCTEPVATIRFRCPEGVTLVRRFLGQQPLQLLLNYLTAQGFHCPAEYKVLTTFPRRDLTQCDATKSLMELKLFPQETLILEEK